MMKNNDLLAMEKNGEAALPKVKNGAM